MKIEFNNPIDIYAAWRLSETDRAKSSSGGIASVMAEKWIEGGGVVYGAAFEKPFSFKHIRCSQIHELERLRGSKYVQSSIQGIYDGINSDICSGIKVLFIGTPCQVAAIKTRFRNKADLLYTIDIICHGTPKVDVLKDSIQQSVLNYDFDNVSFRDNCNFRMSFLKNGQIIWKRSLAHDLYMKGFFAAVFYRECCYQCHFAKAERISDVTLGDFWGLKMPLADEMQKGISLVMINSQKGQYLLDIIKNDIKLYKRTLEEAVNGNKQLRHPMPMTWRHHVFKMLYPKVGFKWAAVLAMPDIVLKNILK